MVAIIKTANTKISRLNNKTYPVCLAPQDELDIKNKKTLWICKEKFSEGSGKMPVRDHDYLRIQFLWGVVSFVDGPINLVL